LAEAVNRNDLRAAGYNFFRSRAMWMSIVLLSAS
jgi:hypothetical protein